MTALDGRIRAGFVASGIPVELVDELHEAFAEAKRRFYRNDLRPSEIEGARFSEGAFRILEWKSTGTYTPLGDTMPKVPTMMTRLEQATSETDSVRLHIPRALRVIYDFRNKRDVAHLADGIDPNFQDATLVVHNLEWVMAELVRLFHNVSANEAQGMIVDLVSKDVPLIQEFDGFPRVLKKLRASDHFMALLYWRGIDGATLEELRAWARPPMRAQIKRTLAALDEDKDFVHYDGDRYMLTRLGEEYVEKKRLLEPQ
jgi:hypothetical protein